MRLLGFLRPYRASLIISTVLAIAAQVAPLVPSGATLQYGPGPVADALLSALEEPVRIDSGIITDAAVALAERGLLSGTPTATYLSGTATLYDWADGREILAPIEHTHDISRLVGTDLVAVNSALQAAGGSASQLTVVSYGEERPVATGSDEASWSQNRRVEIVYTAK